jgi:hypothetical protein
LNRTHQLLVCADDVNLSGKNINYLKIDSEIIFETATKMSTRNLLGGKWRPALKADNLTAICEPIVWKIWEPRHLTALWALTACYRDSFPFNLPALLVTSLV